LVTPGKTVLTAAQTHRLGQALAEINRYFMPLYGKQAKADSRIFATDVEFNSTAHQGERPSSSSRRRDRMGARSRSVSRRFDPVAPPGTVAGQAIKMRHSAERIAEVGMATGLNSSAADMAGAGQARMCPYCGRTTNGSFCEIDSAPTIVAPLRLDAGSVPASGTLFAGKYKLGVLLGEGGNGTVVAAQNLATGLRVAIKFMRGDVVAAGTDVARRFHREARATSRLDHPGVVRVLDFGQANSGLLYIVMERLEGVTLGACLDRLAGERALLSVDSVVDLALQLLSALAAAHAGGLVHRDLKPSNIVLCGASEADPIGAAKIVDFGIVHEAGSTLTGHEAALGSPGYMSPEQCVGDHIDGRSDLYALGVLMFRCLSGRLPYNATEPLALMYQHRNVPVPDLAIASPQPIPSAVVSVVHKSLAKQPNDRYEDADAMSRALLAAVSLARNGAITQLGDTVSVATPTDGPTGEAVPLGSLRAGEEAASKLSRRLTRPRATAIKYAFGAIALVAVSTWIGLPSLESTPEGRRVQPSQSSTLAPAPASPVRRRLAPRTGDEPRTKDKTSIAAVSTRASPSRAAVEAEPPAFAKSASMQVVPPRKVRGSRTHRSAPKRRRLKKRASKRIRTPLKEAAGPTPATAEKVHSEFNALPLE